MNAAISRMLRHIPATYGKDPQDVPALLLPQGTAAALSDLALYVSSSNGAASVDLHGKLVSQVSSAIAGSTVLQDGPAELLLWPDGYGDPPSGEGPATLTIATSPLWVMLAVFSREIETERRSLRSTVRQMNPQAATGTLLDWWGATLGVGRIAGETDSIYATRIYGSVLSPDVNNVSLERLFESLGYSVDVEDTGPGQGSITFTSQGTGSYSQADLALIVSQVKAAGVQISVVFEAVLAATLSLSATATANSPGPYFTLGTSRLGEARLG